MTEKKIIACMSQNTATSRSDFSDLKGIPELQPKMVKETFPDAQNTSKDN